MALKAMEAIKEVIDGLVSGETKAEDVSDIVIAQMLNIYSAMMLNSLRPHHQT